MPIPFENEGQASAHSQKVGLKKVSSQPSMFENMPKKPSQAEFEQQVMKIQEKATGYNAKAAELAEAFNKTLADKTLPQNRNVFQKELERELLVNLMQLAIDINNDPNEQEGMGSLTLISLLFKVCLAQRDKLNSFEYRLLQLEKINGGLDGTKKSG